jgi:KRAB domain-containing zinc finger protein
MEYSCRYCGLKFDKVNNRTSHENRIHKSKENQGLDNFKCKDCQAIFRTQEELRDHSFEHFSGKIHACDFLGCNRKFKKGKLLTVHKKCHFEPEVKCVDCSQTFVQKSGLLKHQKYGRCPVMKVKKAEPTVEEIEVNAKVAQEQFTALRGRLKTKNDSNESLPLFEEIETLSDTNDNEQEKIIIESTAIVEKESEEWHYEYLDEDLIESVQNDTESNPLEVDPDESEIIDVVGTKPRSAHFKKEINPVNRYECDFCGKKFSSRTSIFSHLLVTHKKIADYNCSHCFKHFKSSGNLTRHIKSMHSDTRYWNCDKCGALFKEKYQLETHLHNHDQPSKCETCGKMVTNLKVHLRHHATKKNNVTVECPICGKKMGKYQLSRHIKCVHEKAYQKESSTSSLKVYSCNDCGEYFSRRNDLRKHDYVSHSQNKIYECSTCGNVFRKLKLLNIHRFTHQPLNIKCKLCEKVYARKAALYKHMKKHHPESYVNPRRKSSEWNMIEGNTEL